MPVPDLMESIQTFTIEYDVSCRFFLDLLFQTEEGPSVPSLLRDHGALFGFCFK